MSQTQRGRDGFAWAHLGAALLLATCLVAPLAAQTSDNAAQPSEPMEPAPATVATSGTTTPTNGVTPIRARVVELHGDVLWQAGPDGARKPLAEGDEIGADAIVLTGIGASVLFQIGDEEPYTALVIDSVGKVVLREASTTQDSKRVRVGVGYGRIRAGVAEGGLKSDFTVESPVATLSKRGTWNFGMEYVRGTGEFRIFLLDRGLVEALNRITGQRRFVMPREFVTEAMRAWAQQAKIVRSVPIVDALGQDDLLVAADQERNSGLGVLGPGSGNAATGGLANRGGLTVASVAPNATPLFTPAGQTGRVRRPEGFFGTGRGETLLQNVLNRQNARK